MKNFTILALMMTTTILHAESDRWKRGRDYQVGNIEKRVSMLNKAKSCLQSASSKEEAKTCRKSLNSEREVMKKQHMAKKSEMKAKRKSRKNSNERIVEL